MDCAHGHAGCKQELRPPPCPHCGGPRWWDGAHTCKWLAFLTGSGGLEWVEGQVRRRARCFNPECDHRSSTLYEDQAYPHRRFSPAVAIAAVTELLWRGGQALAEVAKHWNCSTWTLVRWLEWIGGIIEFALLLKVCLACDPSGIPPPAYRVRQEPVPPGPAWMSRMAPVESLILMFELLARLLRDQGVALEEGPGLGAFLRYQLDRFRLVSWLTKPSPRLLFDWLWPGG